MNYQETLDYLYHTLPMFSRVGSAAFKKGLDNTLALCEALGNPQQQFKSIHIAGTNGKGSTSHMLAAILQTAGYTTGLYTSPHLKDFRERIKVNGQVCEESFVIDFTHRIQPMIEKLQPSFFEITVAMAFEWFALQKADVAVIEVGLGGRLDSTNIIQPELSIITNIGWDHMNMLGDTLAKIAAEKAGIIKPRTPVIIGEVIPETRPIFEQVAQQQQAPLIYAEEQYFVNESRYTHHRLELMMAAHHTGEHIQYQLDLPGIYQTKNLCTVLTAVDYLKAHGWDIHTQQVQQALANTKKINGLHGRWELVQEHPAIVLDVCHNEDGIRQMIAQLELTTYRNLHIVIGMVKDKDISKVLQLLPKTAAYYFTKAQIPRALDEPALAEQAARAGLRGTAYADVNTALRHALQHAHKDDLILVCGSVFVVGEVNI